MSVSRRAVLRGGSLAAVLSLAGCLEGFAFGGGGQAVVDGPTTNFVYDHTDLLDGNASFFFHLDANAMATAFVPKDTDAKVEATVDAVASVDEVLGVGFLKTGSKQQGGGTMLARGEVDTGAIATDLVKKGFRSAGDHSGYDLYRADVAGGLDVATAIAGNAVAYGVGTAAVGAADAVTGMVDAGNGKGSRRLDTSADAKWLLERFTSRAVPPSGVFVAEFDSNSVVDLFPTLDKGVRASVSSARALGVGCTVNGSGTDVEAVLLFGTPTEASSAATAAQAVVDRMANDDRLPGPLFGAWNGNVTIDGSALVVTFGTETAALWGHVLGPFVKLATSLTDIDTSAAPNVGFSYQPADGGKIRIKHESGDPFDNVRVVYSSRGEQVSELWAGGKQVNPGDTHTTKEAVSFDQPLQIIWYGGQVPIIIAEYNQKAEEEKDRKREAEEAQKEEQETEREDPTRR
ncbi:hypothetical protein [Haloarchaeobius sp. DFWS5]|uniref:hypothetical protein n=1 Tax=Haloarchaeobius sp. DFWS5 TaxID=3446114 RepID=UPI003EBAD777